MRPRLIALPAVLSLTLMAGACGSEEPGSNAGASSAPNPAAGDSRAALKTANSKLGKVVVDASGRTAYYFTKDTPNSGASACSGECLAAWPPITSSEATPTADGITGKIGTITLADGTKQLTIEGRPVYLFAQDKAPGDVKGQGVNNAWYAVAPNGSMVTDGSGTGAGY